MAAKPERFGMQIMDMRQLRYFEGVARYGSFTHAAARLAIAQPALGIQVRKLERELGTQLFTRSARGAELTEAGRALLESARRILADVEATRQSIRDLGGPMRGRLRLGLAPNVSAAFTVPIVERARELMPRLELSIVESLSSDLVDLVLSNRIDLALAYSVRPAAGLLSRVLLQDEAALVEPRKGGAHDGPIEFAEAMARPLILPGSAHRLRNLVDQQAKKLGLRPNVIFEVQWPSTTLALVASGFGATIMSRVVSLPVPSQRFVSRVLVKPRVRYPLSIVRRDAPASKSEKVMTEIIEKVAAQVAGNGAARLAGEAA